MTRPSGRREAPSAPKPSAIGSAPMTAASVVIRIGRKRSMLASWIAFSAGSPCVDALAREVHDHDAVLLDDAHEHEHADEGVERGLLRRRGSSVSEPADQRRRQRREHRDRVDVALVEDREDHVHHEDGEEHQDRQVCGRCCGRSAPRPAGSPRIVGGTISAAAFSMKSVASPIGDAGLQVEEDRDARELVQVVDRLGPSDRLPRHQLPRAARGSCRRRS